MKRYLFTLLACGAMVTNALAYEGANSDIMARLKQDDPHGFGISILCMSVVFLCLALLFVFFKIFGFVADRQKKIAKVQPIKPIIETGKKIEEVRQITKNILQDGLETRGRDKEIYIAVISMALMQYQEDVHDVESGVLTIKEHQTSWAEHHFNNL
jgi:Na+-transporting methylmalonyl-CoA/oxaloacetate decarboxylase gamma subunit